MSESALKQSKMIIRDTSVPEMPESLQDLNSYVTSLISANVCSTISIRYDAGIVYVTSVLPVDIRYKTFDNYSQQEYTEFCRETLNIDMTECYNNSVTTVISGVKTRVFSLMPPLTLTPVITISTTKTPPEHLSAGYVSEAVWNKIVHSNFIIVGPSGAGKTYLMNYLLNKYIGQTERVALIEEFGEIIPPNPLAVSIASPPPKPGEKPLMEFITTQTNLMRLDMIIIGEIKGAEAWPFILQGASGMRIASTVHGENVFQALNRLRALSSSACSQSEVIDDLIAKGIKYVITIKDKRIVRIEELVGTHQHSNFATKMLYGEKN